METRDFQGQPVGALGLRFLGETGYFARIERLRPPTGQCNEFKGRPK